MFGHFIESFQHHSDTLSKSGEKPLRSEFGILEQLARASLRSKFLVTSASDSIQNDGSL